MNDYITQWLQIEEIIEILYKISMEEIGKNDSYEAATA